jgi:glutamate decarboxylase
VLANARALAARLAAIDGLQLLNDGSRFPIVVVRATDPEAIDLVLLSHLLRQRGWTVPAYTLPPNAEHITVMRMVVKENFSRDMVDMVAHDVGGALHLLEYGSQGVARRPRRRPIC